MSTPKTFQYQPGRVIRWICFNIIFAVGVWVSLMGQEGVKRVVLGGLWFQVVVYLMFVLVAREEFVVKARAAGPSVPARVEGWVCTAFVGVLVYNGWWLTAVGFLLLFFLDQWITGGWEGAGKMDGMDKDGRDGRGNS